eukprot:scaffold339_cov402-Prasinococcus_capsulatus_cf.AAC.20
MANRTTPRARTGPRCRPAACDAPRGLNLIVPGCRHLSGASIRARVIFTEREYKVELSSLSRRKSPTKTSRTSTQDTTGSLQSEPGYEAGSPHSACARRLASGIGFQVKRLMKTRRRLALATPERATWTGETEMLNPLRRRRCLCSQ